MGLKPPPTRQAAKTMRFANSLLLAAGFGVLCGCSTGTDIVPIGPDTYMLGRQGGMFDYTGSVVKAHLYGEASAFCKEKAAVMHPVNSTSQDAAIAVYSSAEIQFKCLQPGDPRLAL
jgi:hypothetical protein